MELSDFLCQYRATPHGATNISPFGALTGSRMNIGIPAVSTSPTMPVHSRIAHNDAISKMKMKNSADQKRHTRASDICAGDHVLVRQQKRNKLTPSYDPDPYTVVEKHGSMIIARRGRFVITRNSSFFKPVNINKGKEEEDDFDDYLFDSQPQTTFPPQPFSPTHNNSTPQVTTPSSPVLVTRTGRRVKKPPKLHL